DLRAKAGRTEKKCGQCELVCSLTTFPHVYRVDVPAAGAKSRIYDQDHFLYRVKAELQFRSRSLPPLE
ncbi:MAG TPA: hypothetical protein VGR71_02910, partial [Nitrospira sp.]|nr:hypothetical protein [Nitrospira sp.]